MTEKTIIKGELKDAKRLCIIIAVLGLLIFLIDGIIVANSHYNYMNASFSRSKYTWGEAFSYAFGLGNGGNLVFIPLIFVCPVIAYFIYKRWSKVEITITDKRVYGVNSAGKRVDLPMDSISAVGTGIFSSLAITTASGAIKFAMLANRDELHKALSNLLVERQGKPVTTISGSDADELKKYKELLDNGVISQEEFDAKKKQLLGL